MKVLSAIFEFIKRWFWTKPVTPEPKERLRLKAQDLDLQNFYTVIEYGGQRINLNKYELQSFKNMNWIAKRKVLEHWRKLERKGHVRFEEINGQVVAIKNKSYGQKEDLR